jgi:alpha-tubulin suppressor-like RCC1 family protein
MKTLRRSRRLPRLVGPATLTLSLASLIAVAPAPAQARVIVTPAVSHVVASWDDNSFGELGDGTMTTRELYGDIAAGSDVVQVAAGRTHNLALRSDGAVWAWGRNDHGQLGRGTVSDHEATPARVAVLNRVTKISAGRDFALALRSDGIVFAWGANQLGQLGNGTTADGTKPAKIAGLARVTGISAGAGHMLALKSDGTVLGWGLDGNGQLGNGSLAAVSGPVQVTGLANATQVAAGSSFSFAVHTVLGLAGQSS